MLFSNGVPTADVPFKRLDVPFRDESSRFRFTAQNDYSKQFAHIYAARLGQMRALLESKAKDKWGDKYPLKKMFELKEDFTEKCILVGTLFKHQQLKPSILRDISEETQLAPQPPRFNFVDEEDMLILEDELQRIRLVGKLDVHHMVTGVVCAVLGYEDGAGKFTVEEYLFYEGGPQKPLTDLTNDPLLVLISGLDQSSPNDFSMSLELFQQWMFGNIDSFNKTDDLEAASIVRIIVAGNSVRSSFEVKQRSNLTRQPESEITLRAVNSVDEILSHWVKSSPVDLMSGEFDPANFMLPQQPMHHCMFPKSFRSKNLRCVTNPYSCNIADRSIVGTSGQNVLDIQRYSKIEDGLEALKVSLVWSHLAPTSPDTLPCYPYYQKDPFIIDECPHVYFAGNMNEFKTDLYQGANGQRTRLVCIPAFSKTQAVAVVNLRTLACKSLSFRLSSDFEL
ncbi:DNA polymerase delta subunit 2 isoform X2 [Bradysia coprophila]|uniref:DNA polymerase delta subunit 2 isoform X2 n=1 Tax=Bradysia coprophila TaxID=38358 RepID=UPI00187DC2AA|nr:DNA polymerase delta subunit 2 isoform X2 [Bradysia coprophila]